MKELLAVAQKRQDAKEKKDTGRKRIWVASSHRAAPVGAGISLTDAAGECEILDSSVSIVAPETGQVAIDERVEESLNSEAIAGQLTTGPRSAGASARFSAFANQQPAELEDSPFGLFETHAIEERAGRSLDTMTRKWAFLAKDANSLASPDDYAILVNKMHDTWTQMRNRGDANSVFAIGEALIQCRNRFFDESNEVAPGAEKLKFDQFLASKLSIEKSKAYRMMQISRLLPETYHERGFSLRQLVALAQIVGNGFQLSLLPQNAESLSETKILALMPKKEVPPSRKKSTYQNLQIISSRVSGLDDMVRELAALPSTALVLKTEKEKKILLHICEKFEALAHAIDRLEIGEVKLSKRSTNGAESRRI